MERIDLRSFFGFEDRLIVAVFVEFGKDLLDGLFGLVGKDKLALFELLELFRAFGFDNLEFFAALDRLFFNSVDPIAESVSFDCRSFLFQLFFGDALARSVHAEIAFFSAHTNGR